MAGSFFSTLEHELGAEIEDPLAAKVEQEVARYIDDFYSPARRHSTLGGVSPVAFEQAFRAKRGNRGPGGLAPGTPKATSRKRNHERPEKAA